MGTNRIDRLSVTLAMDALRDACESLDLARVEVDRLTEERDRLIRDARGNGLGVARLVQVTGLSRERLYRIFYAHRAEEHAE
jgi:hypothetical protein